MEDRKLARLKTIYGKTSKKHKVLCWILVMVIILLTVALCRQEKDKVIFRNGEFIGITSEGMKQNDETPTFQNVTMKITSLEIHKNVDILGKINTTDGDVNFHFTGDLYVSEKQNQGIETYVGQIVDQKNNFVVNYFEIKNDTNYDLLKYSKENFNKRIISFDLERNGVKYYFELDMDILGISFHTESIAKTAPSEIDFYENYVNEEKSVAPCVIPYNSEENQIVDIGSRHSYSIAGERWYYKQVVDSWFGGETIYEYYAEPKIKGEITDIGTAGSSTWTSQLVFDGYVKKDGVRIDTECNVFSMQSNVDESDGTIGKQIEFQISTGENTAFTSGEFDGTCKINGVEDNYRTHFEYSFISGSSNDDIVNSYEVRNSLDNSISLDKTNHNILFLGFVNTLDSEKIANEATNCVIRWTYQICYQKKNLESGYSTIEQTIPYITNIKA